jgi:hypothetical protein
VKPVVQQKRKMCEERRKAVDDEVKRLAYAHFISEIKYPTWLANTVLVKKANVCGLHRSEHGMPQGSLSPPKY